MIMFDKETLYEIVIYLLGKIDDDLFIMLHILKLSSLDLTNWLFLRSLFLKHP
jgi:hypothetical protein